MDKRKVLKIAKKYNCGKFAEDVCIKFSRESSGDYFADNILDGLERYDFLNRPVRHMYVGTYVALDTDDSYELSDCWGLPLFISILAKVDLLNMSNFETIMLEVLTIENEVLKEIDLTASDEKIFTEDFWNTVMVISGVDTICKTWIEYLSDLYLESINSIVSYQVGELETTEFSRETYEYETLRERVIETTGLSYSNCSTFSDNHYEVDKIIIHKQGVVQVSGEVDINMPISTLCHLVKYFIDTDTYIESYANSLRDKINNVKRFDRMTSQYL